MADYEGNKRKSNRTVKRTQKALELAGSEESEMQSRKHMCFLISIYMVCVYMYSYNKGIVYI